MRPIAVPVPTDWANVLPSADFSDAFAIDVRDATLDAPEATRRAFAGQPGWITNLLAVRNILVRPFGLKSGADANLPKSGRRYLSSCFNFCRAGGAVVEVSIMIGFGIIGYLMRKIDLDPAPLVLAFVLGNILETNFRQSLLVGRGTLNLYYTRPRAMSLLLCCVALIAMQIVKLLAERSAEKLRNQIPRATAEVRDPSAR